VLPRLDYCNAVFTGIPLHLAQCLQSVMNVAVRLVFASSKCDHITPLLRQLHWLKVPWQVDYKLAVLVYKCLHASRVGVRLRSASCYELSIPRTRLSTYSDRAFPVATVLIWNSLLQHITSTASLPVFCSRPKTYLYFFELCYP